jgi:hypothetical protein
MLLSGQDLSRTGEAINRAAQHGRRSGARVESGRPTSKGAHYRRLVGVANGWRVRRFVEALLAQICGDAVSAQAGKRCWIGDEWFRPLTGGARLLMRRRGHCRSGCYRPGQVSGSNR